MRITEEEFNRLKNIRENIVVEGAHLAKPNKFHAVISEADNMRFPSKKHRNHYLNLKAMQHAGEIRFFLREVPFDLPGHYKNGRVVRHYVDFMLCLPDGTYRYQEVKGRDLAMGKLKRAQVEDIYKIKIEVI
jgi:hypothetical protein